MMFLTMSVISHWYCDVACGTQQSIMYIVTSVGGEGSAIGASGKAGNHPFAKRKLFQLATLPLLYP